MISIRPGREQDHAYVYSTFVREYAATSGYAEHVPLPVLAKLLEPVLTLWTLTVATPDDDPDLIIGYVLHDGPQAIAWLHTHRNFRGQGIARELLAEIGTRPGKVITPFSPTRSRHPEYRIVFRPWLPLALAHLLNGNE